MRHFRRSVMALYLGGIGSGCTWQLRRADFGVKYNFSRESHGSRWPAMVIALYVEFPTAGAEKQLGSGLRNYNLYGIAQKTPVIWRAPSADVYRVA